MILAHLGGRDPRSTGPIEACSTDRIPSVYRCHPSAADPKPTAASTPPAADAPALALQRIRERLELAAILGGCSHPEQAAAALLGEGVQL